MSRQKKSLISANVNVIFYFLSAVIAFFSRKIFLDNLGDSFIGLTGTVGNMLSLMNMAELGVASAVGISLYKSIFNKDRTTINEIISVFGFLWRKIGLFILGISVLLSLLFPYIFQKSEISIIVIYFLFYSFLASSLLSYFNNYKQILISSDQRSYILTSMSSTLTLTKTLLQILIVINYQSFYGWILLELIFGVLYSLILNYKIKKDYPWLQSNIKSGKMLFPKYKNLWLKTKEIFAHKVSHLVLNETDTILIFSFTSLATVAQYGNYILVATKLGSLIEVIFSGISASVGNLIQEKDEKKIMMVFWEINSFRFFMAGCLVVILFFTLEPMISLWVGHKYIMSKTVLILILVNLYLMHTISTVDLFKSSFGLFQDVWAPISEAVLNLVVSIIFGYIIGINGVLLGTAISVFIFKVLWKPYYLYKNGFCSPISGYWIIISKYLLGFFCSGFIIYHLAPHLIFMSISTITGFLLFSTLITICIFFFYGIFLYVADKGFRNFCNRMWQILPFNKI